ncbi:hypothetical protein LMG28614_05844 [Paraburkholderia ultramafica]|uniref:Uncharacterized protein n=2 Tax=Paraburkholderia ultramafica TaxID=1544867 RepID=A0A6S7BUW5_9BURK|nr:hypothetical protein LMG28614_05844 [Paraburkholderia ultramafica]
MMSHCPASRFGNPFWMLPLLGILRLKSKDLIGYTAIQFFVHFPIVIAVASIMRWRSGPISWLM